MSDTKITTVLPPHSTDFERAVEQASLWVIDNSDLVDVWNPDTCPPQFLPWLAWSVSVDEWDAHWPEARKREMIRQSAAIHRTKGTKGSIKRALAAIDFKIDITEWFNIPNADPYTFRLDAFGDDIFASGGGINQQTFNRVKLAIEHVKSARDHFTLRIGEDRGAPVYVRSGSQVRVREVRRVVPVVPMEDHRKEIALRTGHLQTVRDMRRVTPMVPVEDHRAPLHIRSGHQQKVISSHTHIFKIGGA